MKPKTCCNCGEELGDWIDLIEDLELEEIYCTKCTNELVDKLKRKKREKQN